MIDRRALLLQYAPVVFWIAVIFFLSSDQGSMSQTSRFIRPLLEFLFPAAPEETLLIYHGYIRKAAHFTRIRYSRISRGPGTVDTCVGPPA